MKSDNPGLSIFEYQAPKVLNQAAPVNGTFYPIGLADAEMVNARIYHIGVNIEDNNETLQCQIISDGETLPGIAVAATHSTDYYVWIFPNAINRDERVFLVTDLSGPGILIEGRSVEVQVRKTTAAGVGNLTGIVTWGQKKN